MQDPDLDPRHSANVAVLVAAAVIVVLGYILLHYFGNTLKYERCMEERRRGCDAAEPATP